MSKKDKQRQEPSTAAEAVRSVHEQISSQDAAQAEAAAASISRRDDEQSIAAMAAEIDRLKTELEKALAAEAKLRASYAQMERYREQERARASDEYRRAEEAMLKAQELEDRLASTGYAELPTSGWSSPRARDLVSAISIVDQPYLLGDLLVQLEPYAGETGANETASDILKRLIGRVRNAGELELRQHHAIKTIETELEAMRARLGTVQGAMVARRAPDASAGATLENLASVFLTAGRPISSDADMVWTAKRIVNEWQGLRSFLSPAQLVAVAVRDDSTPGLKERYSLLSLAWDGTALSVAELEKAVVWNTISARLEHTALTTLVPAPYRSRR